MTADDLLKTVTFSHGCCSWWESGNTPQSVRTTQPITQKCAIYSPHPAAVITTPAASLQHTLWY